jgi:hypothetical protein
MKGALSFNPVFFAPGGIANYWIIKEYTKNEIEKHPE